MKDCTPSGLGRLALVLAVALVLGIGSAQPAWADGDPASDVLAQQSLFLPQDAGLSPSRQAELGGIVAEAARAGYAVRVAVIASSTDLGSVTALWSQPQLYARFLGQELSLVYRGPLLVVMPAGLGVSISGRAAPAAQAALSEPPLSVRGDLGATTVQAVRRLAATAGVPVRAPAATSTPSHGATKVVPWIVLALGGALIGAAWTASLRARPPGPRRAPGPSVS